MIIIPTDEYYTIQIPKKYLNKEIEIIIKPIEKKDLIKKTKGIIKNKINPLEYERKIRNEWNR